MSEQTGVEPPDLKDAREWHYVDSGVKKGPVSTDQLKTLLDSKKIPSDTQVWRKGMSDWKGIRDSELAELVSFEPPAISNEHIGNGYVWVLAVLPLVWGMIDAGIIANNQQAAARSLILGFPYNPSRGLPWQMPFVCNGLLALLDEHRLRKAGYGSTWTRLFAVLLVPVYLFMRAKRLKQRPSYAITWVVTFILAALLVGAVQSGY